VARLPHQGWSRWTTFSNLFVMTLPTPGSVPLPQAAQGRLSRWAGAVGRRWESLRERGQEEASGLEGKGQVDVQALASGIFFAMIDPDR
jgi:hypothetical protein